MAVAAKRKKKREPVENVKGSPAVKTAVKIVAKQFNLAAEKAEMSPAQIAKKMGVSEGRVRQILDGRVISLRIIVAFLGALGMKLAGLKTENA